VATSSGKLALTSSDKTPWHQFLRLALVAFQTGVYRHGQRSHAGRIFRYRCPPPPARAARRPEGRAAPSRSKKLPDEACADRGYDSEPLRASLRWLGIDPHVAKRGEPHGSGLGKVRRVVARTISWLKGLRRLRVRYDRLGVIMDTWATLAASVICFRILNQEGP
jgi:transposase